MEMIEFYWKRDYSVSSSASINASQASAHWDKAVCYVAII